MPCLSRLVAGTNLVSAAPSPAGCDQVTKTYTEVRRPHPSPLILRCWHNTAAYEVMPPGLTRSGLCLFCFVFPEQTLYKYYPGVLERIVVVNPPFGMQTIYHILIRIMPPLLQEKVRP
jgi:hypothetical protein